MQFARSRPYRRVLCIALNELLALVALVAAGRQAIHPASWPGAERAGAAGAAIGILQQRLRSRLVFTAKHRRATFLRTTDGAVIAQEQIAVATIDAALLPRTWRVGSPGR